MVLFVTFVMGPTGVVRNCHGTHWWCCSLLLSWDLLVVLFVTFVMRHIRGVVRYCHGTYSWCCPLRLSWDPLQGLGKAVCFEVVWRMSDLLLTCIQGL